MQVTERIIVDANVAIDLAGRGLLAELAPMLAAPSLMVIETRSSLHRDGVRTGTLDYSRHLQQCIEDADIHVLDHPRQRPVAWDLATELGWQKTCDAEYLAAARIHGMPLATYDKQLGRAATRVGVTLAQLP